MVENVLLSSARLGLSSAADSSARGRQNTSFSLLLTGDTKREPSRCGDEGIPVEQRAGRLPFFFCSSSLLVCSSTRRRFYPQRPFGDDVVTGVFLSPPPVVAVVPIAHRVRHSHYSAIFIVFFVVIYSPTSHFWSTTGTLVSRATASTRGATLDKLYTQYSGLRLALLFSAHRRHRGGALQLVACVRFVAKSKYGPKARLDLLGRDSKGPALVPRVRWFAFVTATGRLSASSFTSK